MLPCWERVDNPRCNYEHIKVLHKLRNTLIVRVIDTSSSCRFISYVRAGVAIPTGVRVAVTVIGGCYYMVLGSSPDLPYECLAAFSEELLQRSLSHPFGQ